MRRKITVVFTIAVLFMLASTAAWGQVNVGEQKPEATLHFKMTTTATFELPWRIAFLPDGRMHQTVYVTYLEPGDYGGGQALARAKLNLGRVPRLENFDVIWRQMPRGKGGQAGGQIAFAPDGQSLFMSVGDRQRMTPAQDPNQPVGKILHLTLDGKPAPDNPNFGKTGAATVSLIDPPSDTEAAKTAKVVSTYAFPGSNQTPAETWASDVRAPYGLAFSPAAIALPSN